MYFSTLANIFLTLAGLFPPALADGPVCRVFRVHMSAEVPAPPQPGSLAEKNLDACIAHYTRLDLNRNGVPDWTARYDGRTSDVLYPNDEDLDGDGIANVLDPEPLRKSPKSAATGIGIGIPTHLAMTDERAAIQARIHSEFGIIAIDHTDRHSLSGLEALEEVLRHALPAEARLKLKSVRYVYAFSGHDSSVNIAAYHRQAMAISIGGAQAHGDDDGTERSRTRLKAAIAHELGHAFLFDEVGAKELGVIASRFGHWQTVIGDSKLSSLTDDARLFRTHPLRALARLARPKGERNFTTLGLWREANLVSEYATTNVHEWFADAFAATLLHRLGEKGRLGPGWRLYLQGLSGAHDGYWVNYLNLSPRFRDWLEQRCEGEANRERAHGVPSRKARST